MENINEKQVEEILEDVVKSIQKGHEVFKGINQVFKDYDCTLEEAMVYTKSIYQALDKLIEEHPEEREKLFSEVLSED